VKVRAFIYGRYSTDGQNDKSVDDQFALCRPYCDRKGYDIAGVFGDRAKSGASAINRPDYRRMVAAAIDGECDVIVAEDLDRNKSAISSGNSVSRVGSGKLTTLPRSLPISSTSRVML
jgi:DNA invertase Pin-like site-specific DNA recombinase